MAEAVVLGRFCPLQRRRTASSLRAIGRRKTPVLRTGYGEAIQRTEGTVRRPRSLDCFVAPPLAMTIRPEHARPSEMPCGLTPSEDLAEDAHRKRALI